VEGTKRPANLGQVLSNLGVVLGGLEAVEIETTYLQATPSPPFITTSILTRSKSLVSAPVGVRSLRVNVGKAKGCGHRDERTKKGHAGIVRRAARTRLSRHCLPVEHFLDTQLPEYAWVEGPRGRLEAGRHRIATGEKGPRGRVRLSAMAMNERSRVSYGTLPPILHTLRPFGHTNK